MNRKEPFFSKEYTDIIKGIAIVMMFTHHFLTFPEWWPDGVNYPLTAQVAKYLSEPFKLCVSIFAFLTGYFYCFNNHKTYRYSFKKISDIFVNYWVVFGLFAILAIITTDYHYSIEEIICEAVGLHRPTMVFCWYVVFYYTLLLILPFLIRFICTSCKGILFDISICYCFLPLASQIISEHTSSKEVKMIFTYLGIWSPCVILGYIFASYDSFRKIDRKFEKIKKKWIKYLIALFVFFFSFMGNYFIPNIYISIPALSVSLNMWLDSIYASIFIYIIVKLINHTKIAFKHINHLLASFGKLSLLMWFTHCIFFNNSKSFFKPILYLPQNPVLVLLWGMFLCYCMSFLLSFPIGILTAWKNRSFQLSQKYITSFGNLSSERKAIMGFSILWIVFFHSSGDFSGWPIVGRIKQFGNLGVDIFLLLSGVGLFYSGQKLYMSLGGVEQETGFWSFIRSG